MNAYIELFGREWSSANTSSIRFDNTDGLSDQTRGNTKASAYSTNGCRRRCDEGIGTKVDVEHQGIRAFYQDSPPLRDLRVYEGQGINDIWFQTFRKFLK